jgi:hypothetical protein
MNTPNQFYTTPMSWAQREKSLTFYSAILALTSGAAFATYLVCLLAIMLLHNLGIYDLPELLIAVLLNGSIGMGLALIGCRVVLNSYIDVAAPSSRAGSLMFNIYRMGKGLLFGIVLFAIGESLIVRASEDMMRAAQLLMVDPSVLWEMINSLILRIIAMDIAAGFYIVILATGYWRIAGRGIRVSLLLKWASVILMALAMLTMMVFPIRLLFIFLPLLFLLEAMVQTFVLSMLGAGTKQR